ncbi:MAG: two-component sensor histidine kinase, partial [Legionellales bacterium RIFCSPHIGHO2_12_FULL_42_9]
MRSLYWKIFISFWFASTLIIVTTAWVTSELARKAAIPAHEKVFMDSYANAAVTTYESGHSTALKRWIKHASKSRHMTFYLLCNNGEIISNENPPPVVVQITQDLVHEKLTEGLLKFGNIIVSHEILSTSGKAYRLAAVSDKPLSHFMQITWAGLTIRLIIAVVISGLICYLLSIYLTKPLSTLSHAANAIATGQLSTRVGKFKGHYRDEIAELSNNFDRMADKVEKIVKLKERLLQDISHELRSPLARLQIAIELGRKKSGNVAKSEFSRMEEECICLNSLISEILEYARLDKSVYQLQRASTNIPTLLQHIINDANFEFANNHRRATLSTVTDCKLYVDERLLHRAIENILRNALRYSPAQELVSVAASLDEVEDNLVIEIEDHGPGIPPDQLKNIFNPFYRVDKS